MHAILELSYKNFAYGIGEIESEINKLSDLIVEYNKIINSKELYKLIIRELEIIKDKFSSPRKTKIIDAVLNYNIEKLFKRICCNKYYKSRLYQEKSTKLIKSSKRGVKGKRVFQQRRGLCCTIFTANTHTPVLFFYSRPCL